MIAANGQQSETLGWWAAVTNCTADWLADGGSWDELANVWGRVVADPTTVGARLASWRKTVVAVQLLIPSTGDPAAVPGTPEQVHTALTNGAAFVALDSSNQALIVTGTSAAPAQSWEADARSLVGQWPQRREARIGMQQALAQIPEVLADLPRLGFDADLVRQVRQAADSPLPPLARPEHADLTLLGQARTVLLVADIADPSGNRVVDVTHGAQWRASMVRLARAGRVGLAASVSGPLPSRAR